jgi:hypothetical protein
VQVISAKRLARTISANDWCKIANLKADAYRAPSLRSATLKLSGSRLKGFLTLFFVKFVWRRVLGARLRCSRPGRGPKHTARKQHPASPPTGRAVGPGQNLRELEATQSELHTRTTRVQPYVARTCSYMLYQVARVISRDALPLDVVTAASPLASRSSLVVWGNLPQATTRPVDAHPSHPKRCTRCNESKLYFPSASSRMGPSAIRENRGRSIIRARVQPPWLRLWLRQVHVLLRLPQEAPSDPEPTTRQRRVGPSPVPGQVRPPMPIRLRSHGLCYLSSWEMCPC